MSMQINVPNQYVGAISRDLSGQRRGLIHSVDSENEGDRAVIVAETPLTHLIGYASVLRGLSHGNGECRMDLVGYSPVTAEEEGKVLKMIRGY